MLQFFDTGTARPLHQRDKSGALAAIGEADGIPTVGYCSDATVMGGAMGVDGCRHIVAAIDTAIAQRIPVVGLWHSGGARLAEGVESMHAVGLVFEAIVRASGLVPQISVVLGFAAGAAAYGPALTDVVIMAPEGRMFVTGPDVVRSVIGEQVDMADLGGPDTHTRKSGVAHIAARDEADAMRSAQRLVSMFAEQGTFDLVATETGSIDLKAMLPESAKRAYDLTWLIFGVLA